MSSSSSSARRPAPPQRVRIIGGRWKRLYLPVLDLPGLRPTADRVRETLFNWLGQDLSGLRCADLFAGSGALGFEALSRGAKNVVLLDTAPRAVQQLHENAQRLHAENILISQHDANSWLKQQPAASWDVLFLDPPFARKDWAFWLQEAARILAADGVIYVESSEILDLNQLAETWPPESTAHQLEKVREGRAGMAHFCLLQRKHC
jgi:16S rRNA (guanine966-N2)-methyltransferase